MFSPSGPLTLALSSLLGKTVNIAFDLGHEGSPDLPSGGWEFLHLPFVYGNLARNTQRSFMKRPIFGATGFQATRHDPDSLFQTAPCSSDSILLTSTTSIIWLFNGGPLSLPSTKHRGSSDLLISYLQVDHSKTVGDRFGDHTHRVACLDLFHLDRL